MRSLSPVSLYPSAGTRPLHPGSSLHRPGSGHEKMFRSSAVPRPAAAGRGGIIFPEKKTAQGRLFII